VPKLKQTIREIDVNGRAVFVRVDFNVPLHDGRISDDRRIREALPTLQHLLDQGASLVIGSHLGRPSGDPAKDAPFRMDPVARRLAELIGKPVAKADDTVGPDAQAKRQGLEPGGILVIENLRFEKGEKKGDAALAEQLASLADAYVNDAFGTCHREDASMLALPKRFPENLKAVGFLVEKELQALETLLDRPKRPMVGLMGGAKVSDKIQVIKRLLQTVDHLLIGGAMSYTFLKAQGHEIGKSLCEEESLETARDLLREGGGKLVLPEDHLVTASLDPTEARPKVVSGSDLPSDVLGVDIGPATTARYAELIRSAGTVVWNGPMGKFEDEPFQQGTLGIAQAMAEASAMTAVGGGETAEAVEKFGVADKMSHVSTGGGAFLKALEGDELVALTAIPDRP